MQSVNGLFIRFILSKDGKIFVFLVVIMSPIWSCVLIDIIHLKFTGRKQNDQWTETEIHDSIHVFSFSLSVCFFFHCRQNQITSRTLFKRWKRWNKLCFDKDTKIQMKAIGVNWFLSWLEAIESILELISLYSKSCEKCCLK